ncbi:MAG: Hsp70 family protein [Cyanobacteriota bacterium]|nr:Hsp70 family protein [Cyanobacteriota bacterium]
MAVIAIDFGTSNTVVSYLNPDTKEAESLRFGDISRVFKLKRKNGDVVEIPVIPTLVYAKNNEELILGEKVRSQRLGTTNPERLFQSFKRDLAADFQPPPRQIDGKSYSPEFISERFIKEIWQQLSEQNIEPKKVIFTAPVGAFDRYLDWFRDLGNKLGAEKIEIVDESTAAALGYAVKRPGAIVLVVDFGGGTLDLSLVRTGAIAAKSQNENAPFIAPLKGEVLAKSDAYVGGIDIDNWIAENYLQKIGSSREDVGTFAWQNLLDLGERLKIVLCRKEEAKESWFDDENFIAREMELTREELEEILESRQLLQQLRDALDEVLSIATGKGITKNEIERVLLVGGTCLIPAVQNLLISYFGKKKVRMNKPFDAVAHGALAVSNLSEVEDYLRHTYAIRLWDAGSKSFTFYPLFKKGIKYPCQREEAITLQVAAEGQKEIRLDIGEMAEMSQAEVIFDEDGRMTSSTLNTREEYRSLDTHREEVCVARLEPPGQAGVDRVAVSFEVDERRVLLATVRDILTGEILVEREAIANLE